MKLLEIDFLCDIKDLFELCHCVELVDLVVETVRAKAHRQDFQHFVD